MAVTGYGKFLNVFLVDRKEVRNPNIRTRNQKRKQLTDNNKISGGTFKISAYPDF